MDWLALRDRALHIVQSVKHVAEQARKAPPGKRTKWLEEIFEEEVPKGITAEQRAWLWDCVSGLMRTQGYLGWIQSQLSEKKKPTGWMARALNLALYQVLFQDEAAVGRAVRESVDWVKSKEGLPPSRFVNALLRKASSDREGWRNVKIDSAEKASVQDWMWKRFQKDWGPKAPVFARAMMDRPEVFELRAAGDGEKPKVVQDLANQKLVEAVVSKARSIWGEKRVRVLDLCAAPGGKSVALDWAGLEVTATDARVERHEWLVQSLRERAPGAKTLPFDDVEKTARENGGWDFVWVDAPCSGSGILRRHPEIRWMRQERELEGLVATQRELVEKALRCVRPGGAVVYSVCSLFKDETEVTLPTSPRSLHETERWEFLPGHSPAPAGDGIIGRWLQTSP